MNRLEARNEPQDDADDAAIARTPDMPFTLPRRGKKLFLLSTSRALHLLPADRTVTGLAHRQSIRLPLLLRLALFADNDEPAAAPRQQQDLLLPPSPFVFATHVTQARAVCNGAPMYVYAAKGRTRCYDWVAVRGPADEGGDHVTWYAKLLLLFFTDNRLLTPPQPGRKQWMLVRYLDEVEVERDHVLHARHFAFARMRLQVLDLASLQGRATFAPSPRTLRDGRRVFLMLPYGKCVVAQHAM